MASACCCIEVETWTISTAAELYVMSKRKSGNDGTDSLAPAFIFAKSIKLQPIIATAVKNMIDNVSVSVHKIIQPDSAC